MKGLCRQQPELARDAACELMQSIFWDFDCLERITGGWLQSAPSKVSTVTEYVKVMVHAIVYGDARFAMDTWGLSFFREGDLRIRYEWLSSEQRCLVYYVFQHRKHVFSLERSAGTNSVWVGKTYIKSKVINTYVNREWIVLALIRQLVGYQNGILRQHVFVGLSALCASRDDMNESFVGHLCYALGHTDFTVDELLMLPTRPIPSELEATNQIQHEKLRFVQGVPIVAAPDTRSEKKHQKQKERKERYVPGSEQFIISEWTGEKTRKLATWSVPLNLTPW
jgi:hypothetical protein